MQESVLPRYLSCKILGVSRTRIYYLICSEQVRVINDKLCLIHRSEGGESVMAKVYICLDAKEEKMSRKKELCASACYVDGCIFLSKTREHVVH